MFFYLFLLLVPYNINASIQMSVERGIEKTRQALMHFSSITTERLIIRKLTTKDTDDVFSFMAEPKVVELTIVFELATSRSEVKQRIKTRLERYAQGLPAYWAIEHKENGKVIGLIGIDIESMHCGNIGYAIAPEYWGYGFATEAAKAAINFGFEVLKLKRIEGSCNPNNYASARVLEKCGMKYEGILKAYSYRHSAYFDSKLYAIVQ